jgi:ACS family hexuronate transporter-like MFS transporter
VSPGDSAGSTAKGRTGAPADRSKPTTGYQFALTALLSLNFGFVLFDRNASSFLMPFIQPELGLSNTQVGMLSSGLSLTWALAAFGIGVVSDRTGSRKGLLVLATLAFSVCSFGSGLATGFVILLMTRMLMGVAEGGIMPISQSLIASDVDAKHRGLAMGVAQGFGSSLMGSFVAPVLLVAFAEAFGWRNAFFLAGIPGLVIAALMAWVIRPQAEPAAPESRIEPAAPVRPITAERPPIAVNASTQAPSTARAESGTPASSSYREVLKERNIWICAILSILLVSYLVVCWAFMPLFLTQTRGFEESTMSWLMGALGISATVASFAIPGLSDRIGRRGFMIVMPFVAVILPLGAMYFSGPVWALGVIFVIGWLVTGTMPLFMATVPAESIDRKHIAGALGVCMGSGELIGGVFSPSIAGFAADQTSLDAPLWIMAALALAAGLVACGLRETAPRIVGSIRERTA